MKALQIDRYGGVEVLILNEQASEPTPTKGQLLVQVHAASINPIDYKVRQGYLKDMVPLTFPATLGGDFAGKVKEVGEDVDNFQVGDIVYGNTSVLSGGSGTFAESATVNAASTALKPASLDFVKAAALPLTGASAIQALKEHMHLKEGQKILIHGGAGGIGTMAIQLAKALGAYVATTAQARDKDYVLKLGADEVIDYETEQFEQKLSGFDAVFDTVGGETTDKSFRVLKKGGILVSMVGQPSEELAKKHNVVAIGQGTKTTTERLIRLGELVDSGKVKPQVDRVFRLDEAGDAFTYQETTQPKGKVVFKVA